MKKCPTCDKTFEDSMRFCQVDGTPLVDEAPAFDPYATIVAPPIAAEAPAAEPQAEEIVAESAPVDEASDEAFAIESPSSAAIELPEDVLDLPEADPLKTMYVSDDEMKAALGGGQTSDEPGDLELEPVDALPEPEPPSFNVPDIPAPSFGSVAPPPSPFSVADSPADEPAPSPAFDEPEPVTQVASTPVFDEPQPVAETAHFEPTPVAPIAEWTPPPAPDANWQGQEIGPNTPFQPPPAGVGGTNKTLAIISLICGILGMTVCCGSFAVSIAALVIGFIARGKASQNPQEYGGAGLAMGGIITGGLGVVFSVIFIILYFLGALAGSLGNF